MSKVTVVGCGVMGRNVITAYMNAGHDVVIVDVNDKAAQPFIEKGAKYSRNLQDAPETEIITFVIPTYELAQSVLKGCTKERLCGKYLINTVTPNSIPKVAETAELAREMGVKYIEAKLECYPEDIGRGEGYIVIAAEKEHYDVIEAPLFALGKLVYLGENITSAAAADIANIAVHGAASTILIECAAFCLKAGLPLGPWIQTVRDTMPLSLAVNYDMIVDELSNYKFGNEFPNAQSTDMVVEWRGEKMVRDAMRELGIKTVVSDRIVDLFQSALDAGYNKKDIVSLVGFFID